jgi:hypothetical protein
MAHRRSQRFVTNESQLAADVAALMEEFPFFEYDWLCFG